MMLPSAPLQGKLKTSCCRDMGQLYPLLLS